jgi:signal transduction histidine kinase
LKLADFIAANKARICDIWTEQVRSRYSPELSESQLLDHLPEFIDEVVEALRLESWRRMETAERHGRERVAHGTDIRVLVGELALVGEVVGDLAAEQGRGLTAEESALLFRAMGRGISHSAGAYAKERDEELAEQVARNFSFMAHELRSPLHMAQLSLTLLQQDIPDEQGGEEHRERRQAHLRRLSHALTSLAGLIDNALVEARLGDHFPPHRVRTTSGALVDDALENVAPYAHEAGVEIALEVDDFEIEADPKLVTSALANLLTNAVKFTQPRTRVTLRARPEHGRAVFEVEDRCGGLGPEPEKLFEPFVQQGENKTGFGLGLMIVKRAAEAHRGRVRVEDHPGRGCSFAFELPLAAADAPRD